MRSLVHYSNEVTNQLIMNPTIKQKWISALRSGSYKQTNSKLRNSSEGYCCLGVLCDIYSQDCKVSWVGDKIHGDVLYLPRAISQWAELESEDPIVEVLIDETDEFKKVPLSELNDDGWSFESISHVIEDNL